MRHNRSQSASRRSHHSLKASTLSLCKDCGAPQKPHIACINCGKYKSRTVIDKQKEIDKKQAKAKARSERK